MSFASEVKAEISTLKITNSEKIAELSGFIRSTYKGINLDNGIYIENAKIAKRIFLFLKEVYNVNCEILVNANPVYNKKRTFNIR